MRVKTFVAIFVLLGFVGLGVSAEGLTSKPVQYFLESNFSKAIGYFEKITDLDTADQLFFIECLARGSKEMEALKKLEPLLKNPSLKENPLLFATAGAVYMALGDMDKAREFTSKALALEPKLKRALVTRVMVLLYSREFAKAEQTYESLAAMDETWKNSDLLFNLGLEVYNATGNSKKLAGLYKIFAKLKKKTNRKIYNSLKPNGKMYKKVKGRQLFSLKAGPGTVSIPFESSSDDIRFNMIPIQLKKRRFYVLLDTGNSTGWMLHSLEMQKYLRPREGGRTITRIGTESNMWGGQRQYYKSIQFDGFALKDVHGVFMPKPHWKFPDGNLNPCFIRDRVVTMDFVGNKLILRSKREFETYLNSQGRKISKLRWYGYKRPYVPVTVMGKKALALIETGAEDISFRRDFVSQFNIRMQPKTKYLANGKKFTYHLAEISLNAGSFNMHRKRAEVWSFDRFYHPLTGMTPDVILGPKTFKGQFIISFDPFDNQIILEKR